MGSITVSVKDNRSVLATVGKLVVHGSLQIAKEMLDCGPMARSWVGAEPAKVANNISDVRARHGREVVEGTNGTEVGNSAHVVNLLLSLGTHGLGELRSGC
jgi:hypothetical protein